jgi:hypothetical protein
MNREDSCRVVEKDCTNVAMSGGIEKAGLVKLLHRNAGIKNVNYSASDG